MLRAEPIRTLSLFSGAGGLDIGFHRAGFDIVAAVEIEPAYCASLKANVGPGREFGENLHVHCEDIRSFDPNVYANTGIRCVIGGPPCQTFSAAGRRSGGVLGTDDERGQLFKAYCRVLAALEPEVFVFENVYGLPGANGGGPWREIVESFSALGYDLEATVLDAADYGVPQHRERLFIVGSRNGLYRFPLPTHGPDSGTGIPFVSVRDAIWDLQNENEPSHADLGGLYGHLLPLVPPGLNYSFFTAEMGYPQPLFAWRSKFHDLLYKVDPETPSRTLKARPGKFTGPFHWKNRYFTAVELKRLQSFPDEYELVGTPDRIIEQIGNSVPPRLAQTIARSVRAQLLGGPEAPDLTPRPSGFKSTFRQRQRERTRHFKKIAAREIADRFGGATVVDLAPGPERQSYWTSTDGRFDLTRTQSKGREILGRCRFAVQVKREGSHVDLLIEQLGDGGEPASWHVDVSGLTKYLGSIETLSAVGHLRSTDALFVLWAEIEHALVSRSQFFTLIDIYGHYANRGDTVRIETRVDTARETPAIRAVKHYGSSENCGVAARLESVAESLDVSLGNLPALVSELRSLRFDVRTKSTHPTLDTGVVLCTYPFPLLSHKAHVSRNVRTLVSAAAKETA